MVDPTYNAQNDRWIRFSDNDEGGEGGEGGDAPVGKYLARSKHVPVGGSFYRREEPTHLVP